MKDGSSKDKKHIPSDSEKRLLLQLANIINKNDKFGKYEKRVLETIISENERIFLSGQSIMEAFISELVDRIEPEIRKKIGLL